MADEHRKVDQLGRKIQKDVDQLRAEIKKLVDKQKQSRRKGAARRR
jgi:hypothetical protein